MPHAYHGMHRSWSVAQDRRCWRFIMNRERTAAAFSGPTFAHVPAPSDAGAWSMCVGQAPDGRHDGSVSVLSSGGAPRVWIVCSVPIVRAISRRLVGIVVRRSLDRLF